MKSKKIVLSLMILSVFASSLFINNNAQAAQSKSTNLNKTIQAVQPKSKDLDKAVQESKFGKTKKESNNNYKAGEPTVGYGYTTRGSYVTKLQHELNVIGKALHRSDINAGTEDGIFGRQTYNALYTYQGVAGLRKDGICGPQTWDCMNHDYLEILSES